MRKLNPSYNDRSLSLECPSSVRPLIGWGGWRVGPSISHAALSVCGSDAPATHLAVSALISRSAKTLGSYVDPFIALHPLALYLAGTWHIHVCGVWGWGLHVLSPCVPRLTASKHPLAGACALGRLMSSVTLAPPPTAAGLVWIRQEYFLSKILLPSSCDLNHSIFQDPFILLLLHMDAMYLSNVTMDF